MVKGHAFATQRRQSTLDKEQIKKSSHLTAVKEMQIKVIRRFILQPLDWKTLKKINSYQKPWERKCTLKYGHRRWNITLGKMAGSTA